MRFISAIVILLFSIYQTAAQQKATISGKVVDENDQPLQSVSVQMLNKQKGTITDKNGAFTIDVPAKKPFALVFSYAGYQLVQKNFLLNTGVVETVLIKLEPASATQLQEVTVKDDRTRRGESGTVSIDAQKSLVNPSPIGGIESLIKVFVGSNNELTSQYSVRGGSYDENLIYVNDFEVFRPYLVSSGQQEGLSFINPEMTGNVKFYKGGYQA